MISALRSEPGIFSVTLVAGVGTGFGTVMCHGSILWVFGSAGGGWSGGFGRLSCPGSLLWLLGSGGGVCAAAAETAPKATSVRSVGNAKVFMRQMIRVAAFQRNPA